VETSSRLVSVGILLACLLLSQSLEGNPIKGIPKATRESLLRTLDYLSFTICPGEKIEEEINIDNER
jgi:hypothetical protein